VISSRTDTYKVFSYHADHTRHMNLVSLAKFLQETAGEHAEDLGIGYSKFKQMKIAWVLYKQVVKMKCWPVWGDEIKVKTWPSAVDKLICYREFEIYNSSDQLIGQISTSWLVINLETRRPVRILKYYNFPGTDFKKVIFPDMIRTKMILENETSSCRKYQVQLQDIDVNNHVNNTSYINWALNHYNPDFIMDHQLGEIEMQFQKEAFFGDEIEIETAVITDTIHEHIIKRGKQILFVIRFVWQRRNS